MHFASAVLNAVLFVFVSFVLKIGPLPDVFGAGSFTPFWRMHSANLVKRRRARAESKPRPVRLNAPPPHFFSAASNCARVAPSGSCGSPPAPEPNGPRPLGGCPYGAPAGGCPPYRSPGPPAPGPPCPAFRFGSVIPFFFKHSRSAEARAANWPARLRFVVVALAFV